MIFQAFFHEIVNAVVTAKTGLLSATIDVYDSDGTQVVTAQAMTEIGGGFYAYEYSAGDADKMYSWICNAGEVLAGASRIAIGSTSNNHYSMRVDGTVTHQQIEMAILAFINGLSSGGGGNKIIFKNPDGSTDRITMSVDNNGNRLVVSNDFS